MPSAPGWCCRMPSRHCVISRNEGREVGSICGQEGFPVRSATPLKHPKLPSYGSSPLLPLCRQGCLSCPAARAGKDSGDGGSHCSSGKRAGGRLPGSRFPPWCRKWRHPDQNSVPRERRVGPLGQHTARATWDGLVPPPHNDCVPPGLWAWQRPGRGTARRDPGVTPSWSKAGGCWDTDPSCSLPESNCPLLPPRLTMGSEDRLSAESIPFRAAFGTTPLP